MAHIDYFFATGSSHTYLAGKRLETIAQKHGASITYKPIDLLAVFGRTGGTPPRERHQSRQDYRLQDLARQARKQGLPMDLKSPFGFSNPAPSSYAIIAAQSAGGGDLGELAHSFLRAAWAELRDISDDAVVRDCLQKAGFDPSLADSGMLAGAETYSANIEEAVARGVFGAPFYITDTDERFFGQDRLDDLDLHLAGKL
jgi:2-hydroxychromene-2-carboxylate isomerase